jgi:hypothetical protein
MARGGPAHHLRSRYNMEKRIRVDKTPGKSIVNLEEKLLNYDLLRDRRCDPAAPRVNMRDAFCPAA